MELLIHIFIVFFLLTNYPAHAYHTCTPHSHTHRQSWHTHWDKRSRTITYIKGIILRNLGWRAKFIVKISWNGILALSCLPHPPCFLHVSFWFRFLLLAQTTLSFSAFFFFPPLFFGWIGLLGFLFSVFRLIRVACTMLLVFGDRTVEIRVVGGHKNKFLYSYCDN